MPETPVVNQINIKVDGQPLPTGLMDVLVDVEVDTTLYLPSMFTLRFHDDDLEWIDSSTFGIGKSVAIDLADADVTRSQSGRATMQTVMKGEITGIESEFSEDTTVILIIRGYDKSHRLNRATKTEVYVNMKDSDIVNQLAGNAGLSATTDATSPVHEHVYQDNQTDLAFIHDRARRYGYEVLVDDTKLYFRKPEGDRGELTLKWGDTLRSFHPKVSAAGQIDKVTVKGWDDKQKKAITGQATSSKISPSISIGASGGAVAKSAFSAAEFVETRLPVVDQTEADKLAQAILDDVNADFVRADGVAFGNPGLVAGMKVKLENLGTKLSGTYMVTSAVHVYSATMGYDVHFTVEGAARRSMSDFLSPNGKGTTPKPSNWGGVVIGVVTDNNDPEDRVRVKVKYPWMDDKLTSTWARVASIGAGKERGIYFLPEVDDEVLVAFERGDFDRPVVIGGLWNGKDKPPDAISTVVKSGKVEARTIKTRAGHIIRLSDESGKEKIEIIDKTGKNSMVVESSSGNFTIKCEGNATITAKGNVEVKADGTGKVESGGAMTVKSGGSMNIQASGTLNIKGSSVNIN